MSQLKMEKQWAELSPDEKREIRLQRWLSQDSTSFVSPEAEQSFKAREKRINDAIQLKVPDRVPIWFQDLGFFPAKYTGITFQKIMYDSDALVAAYKKTIVDFMPDMYWSPPIPAPGDALEILDCKQLKWPGKGLPENLPFQYIEGEYMKADEYDAFINDPTDFIIRIYLPRILGALEPFKELPSIRRFLSGYFGLPVASAFIKPELISAFKAFYQAGLIMQKHDSAIKSFQKEIKELGFPLSFAASAVAPFDILSDTFRGMRGVMLDMYRHPDKLLEAIEKLTPFLIESVISKANESGHPRVVLVIHRGADNFMSAKQFETFYWPGYKKIILACIDEGFTPVLFCEGDVTSRLKYLAELPEGKILGLFDSTDMFKAKEFLRDTMCISGLMPLSILQTGTPEQVKEYAKKLIDVVGKDGGFMMGPRSVMDEANPELVKVWFDFTKEYGVY